ncbi:maltokinase N-terminal cap-like domain-containing protein [Streptomyces buecherae]|uniref:maltokinase N-terminal cap-like domain-containing protein n=1 Tax=Streptomyces buecherae TaxID=2763006 RepID=UPI001E2B57B7|nr:maltokinase [Streptomyces buecherae]
MSDSSMSRGSPPTPSPATASAAPPRPTGSAAGPRGAGPRTGGAGQVTAAGPAAGGGADDGLLASLAPLLTEWLPRQRWFAGKGRPISGFTLVSATELLPCTARDGAAGLLHLLVRAHQGSYADAEGDVEGDAGDEADGAPGGDAGAGADADADAGDGSAGRVDRATAGAERAEREALAKPSSASRARRPGAPEPADCYQLLLGVLPPNPHGAGPPPANRAARTEPGPAAAHAAANGAGEPVVAREAAPPRLAHALIGRPATGPLAGALLYEALADPRQAALLLERLRLPGTLGPLRFRRAPGAAIEADLTPRPLAAEQSNSSVVYGDAYILKVFRRIAPGINPDLEVALALTRTGCRRVPPPTAWFEAAGAGAPATLGLLQPYLADCADGWQYALDQLARGADFTAAAHALGQATAEVHLALARSLPTAEIGPPQIEHLTAAMSRRLDAAAGAVPALRPFRRALRGAYADLAALGDSGRAWPAQRIHGDLHLGQALRSTRDGRWSLIDFEGEPASPLAERRRLQPVVRDIAGMLRSFDYAAAVGAGGAHGGPQSAAGSREPREWARRSRAAYCAGYAAACGHDPRAEPELLRAYETDKAVYEVLYEARHRPDWLPVPLSAIRRLAGPAARDTA